MELRGFAKYEERCLKGTCFNILSSYKYLGKSIFNTLEIWYDIFFVFNFVSPFLSQLYLN